MSRVWAALLIGCMACIASAQRKPPAPQTKLPPLPPAVIDDSLAIGGEAIDGRKTRSRMTVEVQVNGQGPYRFVVDSGADTSVIGAKVAGALALPPGRPVMLHSITASKRVQQVRVERLSFGQSAIHDLELPVLDEGDLGGAGMIGIDALVEQRLLLDFDKRVIKVEDAHRPAQRLDGEIVVVARRRKGQLILTQARANGKPVDAVIDTGSEITIGNLALRKQLLRRTDKVTTIQVTGVTGATMNVELARVGELRLGPVLLRDVPVAFADVPPFRLFGLSEQPALLLGTDLMETFRRVSLDFRARKVRFQLKRCRSQGVLLSTSFSGSTSRVSAATGNSAACQ
ncbi:retroviral-like aspartic protease family protein [Sphingomonas sp.]|uniref:retroviral-like aspartic protease family protein n=1 Tax=Sphingomonas sp. TaxID=28214 RepID=UPI002D7F6F65|nr:retroviral-like aspartic protease family protein [Sphingomonas sp.]HEU0045732.1 retroviral-like aspartic protease family protein [Sphingomonas sp.]